MARFALLLLALSGGGAAAARVGTDVEIDDPFRLVSQTWTPEMSFALNVSGLPGAWSRPEIVGKYVIDTDRMVIIETTVTTIHIDLGAPTREYGCVVTMVMTNQGLWDLPGQRVIVYNQQDTKVTGSDGAATCIGPDGQDKVGQLSGLFGMPFVNKSCNIKGMPLVKSAQEVRACIEAAVSKLPSSRTASGETEYSLPADLQGMGRVSLVLTDGGLLDGAHVETSGPAGLVTFDATGQASPGADFPMPHTPHGCTVDNRTLSRPNITFAAEFLQCVGAV
jgi:hypothetical protein